MTDPFPALTEVLNMLLLYAIYLGLILVGVSGVFAGVLFLPIFSLNKKRAAIAFRALQFTAIGLLVILLAIPFRNALIARFPPPSGVPAIPFSTPIVQPTPTSASRSGS